MKPNDKPPGGRPGISPPPLRWPGGGGGPKAAQPKAAAPPVQPRVTVPPPPVRPVPPPVRPAQAVQPAARSPLPVIPNRPCAPPPSAVVQREVHYRHSATQQKFYLSRDLNGSCGSRRTGPTLFLTDNVNGQAACLRYSSIGNDLVIEHVEAAYGSQARGTGALLVYLAAKEAIAAGGQRCYIGMGSREAKAMQFWTSMGFDMTTVHTSTQPVALTTVRDNARNRANNDGWQQSVEKKCFLASACMAARGLPSDCEELEVLRRFREEALAGTAEGDAILREYEEIAPRIVRAIDERPDASAIYEKIYAEIVLCVRDIRGQDSLAAKGRYRRVVETLARDLLDGPAARD